MTLLNIQGVFIAKNCYTHIQDVGNSIRPQNLLKSCLLCPITVIVRETEEKNKNNSKLSFCKTKSKSVSYTLYYSMADADGLWHSQWPRIQQGEYSVWYLPSPIQLGHRPYILYFTWRRSCSDRDERSSSKIVSLNLHWLRFTFLHFCVS